MEDAPDVLVVGAGPVGLLLAIALRERGLSVRVVDRAPATKLQRRAAVVWPRAVEAFDDLGVAAPIVAAANRLDGTEVHAGGRRLGRSSLGHVDSAFPHPLAIEQHDVERILAQQLADRDVRVGWRTEAVDVHLDTDGVRTVLRGPDGGRELVESAWVVGCEGTRSVVRSAMGVEFAGAPRRNLQIIQVDARATWRHPYDPARGFFFLDPGAALGMSPVPGGGYRFFCFMTDPDPGVRDAPSLEEFRDLAARITHAPELRLELTEPEWRSRARFHDRVATSLRSGRALLAGDAAHAWAPIGGHGMNAGFRGAHNLAWKLASVHHGEARPALLDTYSVEQRATAYAVMREMRLNIMELPPSGASLPLVAATLALALALPAVRRRAEWALSDLGRHHRRSPLSWHRAAGRGGLRAGDRVPAALHPHLRYDRWTLLVPPGAGQAGLADDIAASPVRVVPAAVDKIVLVRPDRHAGLVADAGDRGALRSYLAAFGQPAWARPSR